MISEKSSEETFEKRTKGRMTSRPNVLTTLHKKRKRETIPLKYDDKD